MKSLFDSFSKNPTTTQLSAPYNTDKNLVLSPNSQTTVNLNYVNHMSNNLNYSSNLNNVPTNRVYRQFEDAFE